MYTKNKKNGHTNVTLQINEHCISEIEFYNYFNYTFFSCFLFSGPASPTFEAK